MRQTEILSTSLACFMVVTLNGTGLASFFNVPGSPISSVLNLQSASSNDLALGFLLGWFFLLAGFSLLTWFSQRETTSLYYLACLAFLLLLLIGNFQPPAYLAGLDAYLRQAVLLWVSLAVACAILFVDGLATIRNLSSRLHRLVGPAVGLWVIFGICGLLLVPALSGPILAVLIALTGVFLALLSIVSLASGFRPAVYVLAGLVVALVGWVAGLASTGPSGGVGLEGTLMGVLPGLAPIGMTLLFALALYDQQRFARANLEQSNLDLRQAEGRLSQYLEALPFPAAVIGPSGVLIWFNQRFAVMFAPDVGLENFPGTLKDLFYLHPLYRAGTLELYPIREFPVEQALKGDSVRIDDIELERKEGRFPLAIWAEPLLDSRRKPAAALILCQDISARRQSEQELARHIQELQLMVDLRLEELRYEHEDRLRVEGVLHRLATTDPLTGLLNRRHWTSLAERYLLQSVRYNHPLSLILVDIDHFKFVNDIYGHRVGDETLIRIAAIIREALRNVDLLARYGGDEFIILLPDTHQSGAEVVAERLRGRIADLMIECNKGPVVVTLSIGVAEFFSRQNISLAQLIERADLALYGAKHSGRNRVMAYMPMEVN